MDDEVYSEDSDSDVVLSSDDEDGEDMGRDYEHTHPFTGEKYSFETLANLPQFKDLMKKIPNCSDPGHSCRKSHEEYMRVHHMAGEVIPMEKSPVRVLSRQRWGAAPPRAPPELPSIPTLKVVFYYNLGVDPCLTEEECKIAVRELQRRQMEEDGLSDIAFNFVVGGDKNIYEGRGWHAQPDKTLKYPQWRHRRLDIAFMAPVIKGVLHPDHPLMYRVFDFIRTAIFNYRLHAENDLYQINDHYKCLVPSPPYKLKLLELDITDEDIKSCCSLV